MSCLDLDEERMKEIQKAEQAGISPIVMPPDGTEYRWSRHRKSKRSLPQDGFWELIFLEGIPMLGRAPSFSGFAFPTYNKDGRNKVSHHPLNGGISCPISCPETMGM